MYQGNHHYDKRPTRYAASSKLAGRFCFGIFAVALGLRLIGFISPAELVLLFAVASVLAVLALLLGFFAVLRIWFSAFGGTSLAIGGIAFGFIGLLPLIITSVLALLNPLTNDVATLSNDPPALFLSEKAKAERAGILGSQTAGPLMLPTLFAIQTSAPLDVASAAVLQTALSEGWQFSGRFTTEDGRRLRLAFVARTLVLGFSDDIVLELRDTGERTEVHMRSASRLGRSDLGANERRIRNFLKKLSLQLNSGSLKKEG